MKHDNKRPCDESLVSVLLHDLSQPITALQCSLEIGLRQDKTPAELRRRLRSLLEVAQDMRKILIRIRGEQQAGARNS